MSCKRGLEKEGGKTTYTLIHREEGRVRGRDREVKVGVAD
jgi:hypothetical protein